MCVCAWMCACVRLRVSEDNIQFSPSSMFRFCYYSVLCCLCELLANSCPLLAHPRSAGVTDVHASCWHFTCVVGLNSDHRSYLPSSFTHWAILLAPSYSRWPWWRLRQEDHKFNARLEYMMRNYLKRVGGGRLLFVRILVVISHWRFCITGCHFTQDSCLKGVYTTGTVCIALTEPIVEQRLK